MNATITAKEFRKALNALAEEGCANMLSKTLETAQQKSVKKKIQRALEKAKGKKESRKLVKLCQAFRQATLDVKTRTRIVSRGEKIAEATMIINEYMQQSNDAGKPQNKLWAMLTRQRHVLSRIPRFAPKR
ncbi:hypothetical protein HY992_05300 [Candidatus Micrarchaeota archaeon]|nr:hypothetical protein [Candidatus Micrarchaeota archaeon]